MEDTLLITILGEWRQTDHWDFLVSWSSLPSEFQASERLYPKNKVDNIWEMRTEVILWSPHTHAYIPMHLHTHEHTLKYMHMWAHTYTLLHVLNQYPFWTPREDGSDLLVASKASEAVRHPGINQDPSSYCFECRYCSLRPATGNWQPHAENWSPHLSVTVWSIGIDLPLLGLEKMPGSQSPSLPLIPSSQNHLTHESSWPPWVGFPSTLWFCIWW